MINHMRKPGHVDLHCHSTASDGSLSPSALAQAAHLAGLSAMALTDHDTVDGLGEFLETSQRVGLNGFGGVELSLEYPGTFHLLGLNISRNPHLPDSLKKISSFREERNVQMLDTLNSQGYHIDLADLLEISGGLSQAGRPHFVSILVQKGYFSTPQEVFDQLLGQNKPGYIKQKKLPLKKGFEVIIAAGWAPVLAHPVTLGLPPDQWPKTMEKLAGLGLVGLEVYHPLHTPDHVDFFLNLAHKFKLVPTAGSDFHGSFKPHIPVDWVRVFSPLGKDMIDHLLDKIY